MNNNYFQKAWNGPKLKDARETSDWSIFEELPPIPNELSNDFSWIKPFIQCKKLRNPDFVFMEELRSKHYGEGVDYSEEIVNIEKQLAEVGIKLPEEISIFFSSPEINGRIRSTTDNYYDLSEFVEVISANKNYYLVHFYSDSQYCLLWYICFNEDGTHFIIATPKLYGHKDSFDYNREFIDYTPSVGYICANSFKEFIYRYDIEQRIWFKTIWYEVELDKDEQKYINHYRKE